MGQFGDLLGIATLESSQFYPFGFEGEIPLLETGDGNQAFLRIFVPDVSEREAELNLYGGIFPEDKLTAKHVRKFMLSARRLGARGLPRLTQVLQGVAAQDGSLDGATFARVAMAEGLCSFFDGCTRIFEHYMKAGGGVVRVDALMKSARGIMKGKRLEAVRDVWRQLDPEGQGYVKVEHFMSAFDGRLLPAVRYDGVSIDTARRE